MDDAIGRMIGALERTGQRENTLVIFTSDNGGSGPWTPPGGYPGTYAPCPVLGNNLPLRGGKGTVYEGGIRVPAFVNWPGVLAPRKLNHPVHIVDWMPTLLARADAATPGQPSPGAGRLPETAEPIVTFDGMDVWGLLTGAEKFPDSRVLYFKRGSASALRYGRWKLVEPGGEKTQLFNLDADPNEERDLAGEPEQAARIAQLRALLDEQRAMDREGIAPRSAP
jgi:arylsulfatase A-like enzyme